MVINVGKNQWTLGGKIDGTYREIQHDTIIEFKKRVGMYGFFNAFRERIQLEVYMRLTGKTNGKIIQQYLGDTRETDYTIDEDIWVQIQTKVSKFVDSLYSLNTSIRKQDLLMKQYQKLK